MHNIFNFAQPSVVARVGLVLLGAVLCSVALAQQPAETLVLGGGGAVGPRYAGSSEHSLGPMLVLDYSTAGGLFASTLRGVGYGGQVAGLSYSAAFGYRGGRSQKNQIGTFGNSGGTRLQGMGDVEANVSAVVGVAYALAAEIELGLNADLPVSQIHNGKNMHAQVSGPLYIGARERLVLGVGAGFADDRYAQTYYGVSARQALTSRFPAFRAGAGIYEVSTTLTWTRQIDERWGLTSMLAATRLLRDAAHSPVAERRTAPTAAVYATYNY